MTDLVPGPGQLHVQLDGDATASLALDFGALANQALLNDPETAPQVAASIEAGLRNAVDAGAFRIDGVPVTDATRRAELRAATVRWDRQRRRFVVSSGRRGPVAHGEQPLHLPSRVALLTGPGDVGTALGLHAGAVVAEGRIVRHRTPTPLAVAVDVRFDVWAGAQRDLATLMDAWAQITPTRGQFLLQPALLAAAVPAGATTVRLQTGGESLTHWTLAQFEPDGGFADRLSGQQPTLATGAVAEPAALRLTGTGTATIRLFDAPAIPHPWQPEHPGPTGYAMTLGLRMDAGAAAGNSLRLVTLEHAGRTVLRLEVRYVTVNGDLLAEFEGRAEQAAGPAFAPAIVRLPAAALETDVELHMLVEARRGAVTLFVDGVALAAAPGLPTPPPAPGTPAGGSAMLLTLGTPEAPGTPVGFRLTHVQLHGRPLGPVDPQLRRTTATAGAWAVGDPIALVRTENGFTGAGEAFVAAVIAVSGDTVTLNRPVVGDWPRASTLVYKRSLFFAQKQLRRRDDLMNNLYRMTFEYRVSAFLDELFPSLSAPLVEVPDVQIRELSRVLAEEEHPDNPDYPARPIPGRPGVRTIITRLRGNDTTLEGGRHG
jgi:hypothetical protein